MFIQDDKKFHDFFEIYKNLKPILQDFLVQTTKGLLKAQRKL